MISLEQVSRSFGTNKVLDDVSFSIHPGRMTGFVGANGAGKTTSMRVLLGVLTPDSGRVTVDGSPITHEQRSRIGYMPEERGLYPKMPVIDQLVYFGRLHGMSRADARVEGLALLERLQLKGEPSDLLEKLSLGNQQRAQIAAALVHRPDALVLDEPFSGLDPIAIEHTLDVLREVADRGAPVLFSSHQLELVERLVDDIVILDKGRIVAAGTADELRASRSRPEWTLESSTDLAWVRTLAGVEVVELDGHWVRFAADDPGEADRVLRAALERGTVTSFSPYRVPLTRLFQEVAQA